jgi:hypothetical protein
VSLFDNSGLCGKHWEQHCDKQDRIAAKQYAAYLSKKATDLVEQHIEGFDTVERSTKKKSFRYKNAAVLFWKIENAL